MHNNLNLFVELLCFITVQSTIDRRPSDAIYHPGNNLRLNCSSDIVGAPPVAWKKDNDPVFIGDTINTNYSQLFNVSRTYGYDLIAISKPVVAYCGVFSCAENDGFVAPSAFASVSVAEQLQCTCNVTKASPADTVGCTCTAQYCNVSSPTVFCLLNGSPDTVTLQISTIHPTPSSVKAEITAQAGKLYGSVVTCYATYDPLGNFSTDLPNITQSETTTSTELQSASQSPGSTGGTSAPTTTNTAHTVPQTQTTQSSESPVTTTSAAPPSTNQTSSTNGASLPTTTSTVHAATTSEFPTVHTSQTHTTQSSQSPVTTTSAAPESTSQSHSTGGTSSEFTTTTTGVPSTQPQNTTTQSPSTGITTATTETSKVLAIVLGSALGAVGAVVITGVVIFVILRVSSSAAAVSPSLAAAAVVRVNATRKPATYQVHSDSKQYAGYPLNKSIANPQTPYYCNNCLAIQRLNGGSYYSNMQNFGQGPFVARGYRPTVGVADPRLNAFYSY